MKRDRNTNDEYTEEVIENDGVSESLGGHESPVHCIWRQNLQSESNQNEGSEKKRRKVISQKGKLLAEIS
jgi:hypothetical protein